jgi:hypothetical protein
MLIFFLLYLCYNWQPRFTISLEIIALRNVRDLEVEHDVVVEHFQNLETRQVPHNHRMGSYNS